MKTLILVIVVAFVVSLVVIGLAVANNARRHGQGRGVGDFLSDLAGGWRQMWRRETAKPTVNQARVQQENYTSLDDMFATNPTTEPGYMQPPQFEQIISSVAQQLGRGRKD